MPVYSRICAGCGAKIDPSLFGQQGRSVYHLREVPGSERVAACAFCRQVYHLPLYEIQPVRIRYKAAAGGGERAKAGRRRK